MQKQIRQDFPKINSSQTKLSKWLTILLSSFLFLNYSCSPIEKLAKKYIQQKDTIAILLLFNDTVFYKNERYIENGYGISAYDDAAIAQTKILKKTDKTILKTLIYENFSEKLKKFPFVIYQSDSVINFMAQKKQSFIVNVVQLEIIEFDTKFEDSQQFDTITFFENFNLNSVSINLWFEISMLNNTNESTQLVYYSSFTSDYIEGKFRKSIVGNDVKYIYKRYDISSDDVYSLAQWIGQKNAGNVFDFFLNRYIFQNYSGKASKYYYVTYDDIENRIKPANDDRFIFMGTKNN